MAVTNIFDMVTLLIASLMMVAAMAYPPDKDLGSLDETGAASRRFRDTIHKMVVSPAMLLKNMTSKEIEKILQAKTPSSCSQPGYSQKIFMETGRQSFSCMKNELSGPVEEIDDILTKEAFVRKDAATALKLYCKVSFKVIDCIDPFINATKTCLGDGTEARWSSYVLDLIHPLNDFSCFKDGKRIMDIIEDDVPQCMEDKKERVMACLGDPTKMITDNNEIECGKLLKVQKCVVDILGKCEKKSTAGITKSYLDLIVKDLPCKD